MAEQRTEDGKRLRLMVRVLEDVAREGHTTYADLLDAFKCRCAKLRIGYSPTLVGAAVNRVEHGGQVPLIAAPRPRREAAELETAPPPITRAEAHAILTRLFAERS